MAQVGLSTAPRRPTVTITQPATPSTLSEEVRASYDYLTASSLGYLAGLVILGGLFWSIKPAWTLTCWLGTFLAMIAVRLEVRRRFNRAVADGHAWTDADWQRWQHRQNIGTLVAACLWGATGWLFYQRTYMLQHVGLIIVIYVYCVAAIPVLAMQPRLYLAYACLCFMPLIASIAFDGSAYGFKLAAMLLLVLATSTLLARNYQQTLQRVIELKGEADGLLTQLRAEKQAADAARREAEVANRAKTQFFAAASHDLRQPLHAMGLFAEALRAKVHDQEVAPLVNSINESVDALEGLFSELLDMTRIDAGGVEVVSEHFAVGDILRKLRLHFEPTAFEKGLSLRLRGAGQTAFTDPLLVERILRNLVSNAIRYTDDGSVLVSCRQRGQRLLLQVWDTGRGIAESEQSKVFDEFYQVAEREGSPVRQRKGLGLGLAIVKRLADLMQAPLTMRSRLRHGTVFTLEVPIGRAARTSLSSVPGKAPSAITLDGRLIVIVEDEPAVRVGLEALLQGWGATLASFDSVAACRAWIETLAPQAQTPELIIADHRLENGRTGVDAIEALRKRFGTGLPAIVVTGSTMTGHEHEAHEHDFHLLIKPVVPNKLRAMIAFKLGAQRRSETS